MRRGLMKWREDELSLADVTERVERLRAAMTANGLDAFLAYTTLVRPAAVQYFTGFTPYWSDGLLLITREGKPTFVTALSKRVGNWLAGVNPTSDIAHAPRPGRKIAEVLAQNDVRRLGVLEPDMLPGALVADFANGTGIEIADAGDFFASVRAEPNAAETRLAVRAEAIALSAFKGITAKAESVGDVAGPLELAVRNAGAEECYIALSPDLAQEALLGRHHGSTGLGEVYAARISIAYNGVWTRVTRTLRRGEAYAQARYEALAKLADGLDPILPMAAQIAAGKGPLEIDGWTLEAPVGTRPLARVAHQDDDKGVRIPYGVMTLRGREGGEPFVHSALVPTGFTQDRRSAA